MNIRKIVFIAAASLLSFVFFFCSKNQPPTAPVTPAAVKILSFAPGFARVGDQVVITGENFSANKTADSVFFSHGKLAAIDSVIDSATTFKLYARVPQGTVTGVIAVRTGSLVDTSKQIFTLDTLPRPTVINLQPGTGPLGTIITITGTNFDTAQGHTVVTMGGVREKIISISPTKIVVEIVAGVTGPVTIAMNSDTVTMPSFTVTKRNETIASFAPTRGKVGMQVTITGTNFNPDTMGLAVTFGNVPAQVMSATATQIVALVPQGAATAPISISFFGEQATSAMAFQVEGKYFFDSVYIEIRNLPAKISQLHDSVDEGTTVQNISYPTCFTGFLSNNRSMHDTMIYFTYIYHSQSGVEDDSCENQIGIVFDTMSKMIRYLSLNEGSRTDFNFNGHQWETTTYRTSMQFANIPYENDSITVSGTSSQIYFINGNYTYEDYTPGPNYSDRQNNLVQFLPFTDSTYIKIILK